MEEIKIILADGRTAEKTSGLHLLEETDNSPEKSGWVSNMDR